MFFILRIEVDEPRYDVTLVINYDARSYAVDELRRGSGNAYSNLLLFTHCFNHLLKIDCVNDRNYAGNRCLTGTRLAKRSLRQRRRCEEKNNESCCTSSHETYNPANQNQNDVPTFLTGRCPALT